MSSHIAFAVQSAVFTPIFFFEEIYATDLVRFAGDEGMSGSANITMKLTRNKFEHVIFATMFEYPILNHLARTHLSNCPGTEPELKLKKKCANEMVLNRKCYVIESKSTEEAEVHAFILLTYLIVTVIFSCFTL